MSPPERHPTRRGQILDPGRVLAQILTTLFALVGGIPLVLGALLQSEPVSDWGAVQVSRVLSQQLGLAASFQVQFRAIPLSLELKELRVPSLVDPNKPAISVSSLRVRPRLFSLLGGQLDAGDIEIGRSEIVAKIRDGKVQNFTLQLPKSQGKSTLDLEHLPFRSLAWTSARFDVEIDERRLVTEELDLDVFASVGQGVDVALRVGGATFTDTLRYRPTASADAAAPTVVDRLCALDLRSRLATNHLTVQRLSLLGAIDLDPAAPTRPVCGAPSVEQLALRLTEAHLELSQGKPIAARGSLFVRGPVQAIERYVPFPKATGAVGFSGDAAWRQGDKLPEVNGQLLIEEVSVGKYRVGEKVTAEVRLAGDTVLVPRVEAAWGNGHSVLEGIELHPFSPKGDFKMERMTSKKVDFPGVMRDVGVTAHTIVDWHYDSVVVSGFRGTMKPFFLDGAVQAQTSNFIVWNKGFDHPERKRMIGVPKSELAGRFRAHKEAVEFYAMLAKFGTSRMPVEMVSIGLGGGTSPIRIELGKDAELELADVSPVANLPLGGRAHLALAMTGPMNHPTLQGKLNVDKLSLGRFELGDIAADQVHFEPLKVKLLGVTGTKNAMSFASKETTLRFDGKAPFELSMSVTSDRLNVPELIRTLHFDDDPRFAELKGHGTTSAEVSYRLGGPEDICDGGRLKIAAEAQLEDLLFLGERFGPASGAFRLDWFDIEAGTRGMDLDVEGIRLGKGSGALYGNAHVSAEAKVEGNFLSTRIPIGRIDAFGATFSQAEGFVSGTAKLDGRLDALHILADTRVSELRVANTALLPSELSVEFLPEELPLRSTGERSGCGRPIAAPFSQAEYEKDVSDGSINLRGSLFGGAIQTADLRFTQQRARVARGEVTVRALDLGALGALAAPDGKAQFQGALSGKLVLDEYHVASPFESRAAFDVASLRLSQSGFSASTAEGGRISLGPEGLRLERSSLVLKTPNDEQARLEASALLGRDLSLVGTVRMQKTPLRTFLAPLSAVDSAEGTVEAGLDVTGTLTAPAYSGYLDVSDGKVTFHGVKTPLSELNVRVGVKPRGVEVEQASANFGGGSLAVRGGAPFAGGKLGNLLLDITARGVSLPLGDDFRVTLDADLDLDVPPGRDVLPKLTGRVDIDSARYERAMSMTADLATLGSRGKKTEVVDVNPADARLDLDVVVFGRRPLQVKNELVDAGLIIDPNGVRISGTDQKLGAVGNIEVASGGRIVLRQNEFEVQNGIVRFSDPVRLRPEVDVTAINEFRRNQGVGAFGSAAATQVGTSTAGNYRIALHAYGSPEDLKIDLTSDPPLAQDDIFLLLTIGLTRRELDRTQSAGVGSSAALEALGTLTGAESAVSNVVKVDEFRFGSTYSSRTGRTEPTVTIGKRLSERIRASVTSSISEANELRSNVEYQATPHLSVEGTYDNAQRSGAPTVGNIGGDIRWRLEFD